MTTQSLESGFALKLHALLCRSYVKGRDWYDFVWYVARGIRPDPGLFANALHPQGPWRSQEILVTHSWLREAMKATILRIDWSR